MAEHGPQPGRRCCWPSPIRWSWSAATPTTARSTEDASRSNWELSTARALAVARVLIRAGVPPDKVVASGFGEHHPRAANQDESRAGQEPAHRGAAGADPLGVVAMNAVDLATAPVAPVAGDRPDDTAILARALFSHTVAAFKLVPEDDRGAALAALDRFIASPGPAAFMAAARELREARRRVLIEQHGGGTLRRALAEGIRALRTVPGLPAAVSERLASDLPVDAMTGHRLSALCALARAYEDLAGRVAADTDEMRRRYQAAPPRKRRPRPRS